VYFSLTFVDDEMFVPTLEPLVYVGRDLESGDEHRVYFQDVDSFRDGVQHGPDAEERGAVFYSGSANETSHIYRFDEAIVGLTDCAARRRTAGLV
jgi:hypothetical protein